MPFTGTSKADFLKDLRAKKISYQVKTWTNYMENVEKSKAVVVQVDSEDQVQEVMQAVKKQNAQYPENKITVRATAGWADKESEWCCFPWAKTQEERYNESFSFSGGSAADIIIRFSPKYQKVKKLGEIKNKSPIESQNPLDHLRAYEVWVTAGVQIAALAQKLRELGLSMRTASMLSWASAVGLAATGGHGTGRDEPAFSGQITGLRICDQDGNIREINSDHEDFATLCSAHSGALGIVLGMKLKTVEAFNLKETIHNFPNVEKMSTHLNELLSNNQYFSLIGVPSHGYPHDDLGLLDKWQIRLWNYTQEARTKVQDPPYTADARSWAQELSVRAGDSVQEFLLDSKLIKLLPQYLLVAAAAITGTRGTKPLIDHENSVTHYQVAFPKAMRDVSYLLPVKDKEAGALLANVLQKIDDLVKEAAGNGECPITYAVYARYIKGTTGGLSTSSTNSQDEHILALDIVTHPNAPGIANFEKKLLSYLSEIGIKPRFHLGKNFPNGIHNYADFLQSEAIASYKKALAKWYGGKEQLEASPFITPYFEQMLEGHSIANLLQFEPEKQLIKEETPRHDHSIEDCSRFLEHLIPALEVLPSVGAQSKQLKEAFISQCRETLETMKEKQSQESSLTEAII